jgi:hypothetical protein
VFYEGNLLSYGNYACHRWYFSFDGAECATPASIEGVLYMKSTDEYTHNVTGTLKATVTSFLKVTYVWDFGLASARFIAWEMLGLVINRSLVL